MSHFNNEHLPRKKQVLFNRYHASLRMVIERTFEVRKKKLRILCHFSKYDIHVQKRVLTATMRLHNFIRISNYFEEYFVKVMRHTNIIKEDSKVIK